MDPQSLLTPHNPPHHFSLFPAAAKFSTETDSVEENYV